MGTFTLTQVQKKTVLLLGYCGRHSSRYFILMQYKLKNSSIYSQRAV